MVQGKAFWNGVVGRLYIIVMAFVTHQHLPTRSPRAGSLYHTLVVCDFISSDICYTEFSILLLLCITYPAPIPAMP
jgi:hypothetical protein